LAVEKNYEITTKKLLAAEVLASVTSYLEMAKQIEATKLASRGQQERAPEAERPKPAKPQPEPDYRAEAEKAQRLLREQGWCVVWSRVLGEPVVWVRDAKVVIPARWQNAVKYTLAELEALTRPPKPDPEGLRKLHEAKRVFGGEIGAGEPRGGADVGESSSSQKGAALPGRTLLGEGAARRSNDRPFSPGLLSPSGQVAD